MNRPKHLSRISQKTGYPAHACGDRHKYAGCCTVNRSQATCKPCLDKPTRRWYRAFTFGGNA